MLAKTSGIVLKQVSYSESSIIVKIFTEHFGLLSFIVKGAKNSKKNNPLGVFRPLNVVSIDFYKNDSRNILSLKEYSLIMAPDVYDFGIHKISLLYFIFEVLNKTIQEEGEVDENKFHFITSFIYFIKAHNTKSFFYLYFLIHYSKRLGIDFESEIDQYAHLFENKKNEIAFVEKLFNEDLSQVDISIDSLARKNLYNIIILHYKKYYSSFNSIKTIQVLEQIL